MRLRVDAMLPPPAGGAAGSPSALEAASELLQGPADAFFASTHFSVARRGEVATFSPPAGPGEAPMSLRTSCCSTEPVAPLPPLGPLAVCSARRARLAFLPHELHGAPPPAAAFRARFHGAFLSAAQPGAGGRVALAPTGLTGVALFEPAAIPFGCPAPPPRPVLLTPDAAIAAEARSPPPTAGSTRLMLSALDCSLSPLRYLIPIWPASRLASCPTPSYAMFVHDSIPPRLLLRRERRRSAADSCCCRRACLLCRA